MAQCKATSKRTHERCKAKAMRGMEVCYHHGGASLRGVAHPGFRTGRYSKYIPTRLTERYELAVTDPELLNLSEEIALVDSRLADVLARVDSGESTQIWDDLQDERRTFLVAQRRQDQQGMADALAEILNLIARGHADWAAWMDVVNLVERRRRLVESEQKRRIAMSLLVKVEDTVEVMRQIADAVQGAVLEHVTDGDVRRRVLTDVQAGLSRYLGGRVPPEADGRG